MPPEALSDSMRPMLQAYLSEHKDALVSFNDINNDLIPCNWLKAYATVMTKTSKEKLAFVASQNTK